MATPSANARRDPDAPKAKSPFPLERALWGMALVAGVLPLWVGRHLPMVDLPQHLLLISALHRLHDPTTLYPHLFALRPKLTPYLGYYWLVALLNWLVPLGMANKLFLTAYVVGLPLSMAFLLKSLRRPTWPALLALPFAYGDSFAWGFINYVAAIPLALCCCGLFVRAVAESERRRTWAWAHAGVLVLVLLFHVQVFVWLGLALPFLLLTTAAPEDARTSVGPGRLRALTRPRAPVLLSVIPAVALFFVWVVLRLGHPAAVQKGAPWKAWGPMLSAANLSFKPFSRNLADLWAVLANQLRDGSDRWGIWLAAAVVVAAIAIGFVRANRAPSEEGAWERWRVPGLAVIALLLFFTLPFDIRGYMYYLNTRFAHLAAPLIAASVPPLRKSLRPAFLAAAACVALLIGLPLAHGFHAFDEEAAPLDTLAPYVPRASLVMGMIFATGSRVVTHPVYLHAATELARLRGGATNFTFALTPHNPLMYRRTPPPTFPSEWHPEGFRWDAMAKPYSAFLVRGIAPWRVFGDHVGKELSVAARAGDFWLVVRRGGSGPVPQAGSFARSSTSR